MTLCGSQHLEKAAKERKSTIIQDKAFVCVSKPVWDNVMKWVDITMDGEAFEVKSRDVDIKVRLVD